jgi:hypothetical protein
VAVLSALALFVPSAHAIIMHDAAQYDPAWRQEYVDLGKSYDSVVAVFGRNEDGWKIIGSGTVISPYNVIFAAHSALYNSGELFLEYRINTGTHLINDRWARYETYTVDVMPGYTGVGSPDLAIWTFDEVIRDVTLATLYTGDDSDLIGSVVDFIGFGATGYLSGTEFTLDGAKRGCQNVLEQLGYPPLGYGTHDLITFLRPPGHSLYQHLGGTQGNFDSGGGWFVDGELVAVNNWRGYPLAYGIPGGATSISQHAAWIDSVIVPEPSSVLLLVIALVSLFIFRWKRR